MHICIYWAGVVCVVFWRMQMALTQDKEVPAASCPDLSLKSAVVLCQTPKGRVSCTDMAYGTIAKIYWRKSVLHNNFKVGPTKLACTNSGSWKRFREVSSRPRSEPPASSTTTFPTATARTSDGYTVLPGYGEYRLLPLMMHWKEANTACSQEGASLPFINSMEELREVMYKILTPKLEVAKGYGFMLGVTLDADTNQFKGKEGQVFPGRTGLTWASDEHVLVSDKACVTVDYALQVNDVACSTLHNNIICKRPWKTQ